MEEARPGDIVVLAGIEDVTIGDTICTRESPRALPRIRVDEPTVAMRFGINTSPLAGREGKLVQSRAIQDRLVKESLRNVAIRVEETSDRDAFLVKGGANSRWLFSLRPCAARVSSFPWGGRR